MLMFKTIFKLLRRKVRDLNKAKEKSKGTARVDGNLLLENRRSNMFHGEPSVFGLSFQPKTPKDHHSIKQRGKTAGATG